MNVEIPPEIQELGSNFVNLWLSLPALCTREAVYEKAPVFNPRTMANRDAQGTGPTGRMRIGPKVVYSRDQFVLWLAAQTVTL